MLKYYYISSPTHRYRGGVVLSEQNFLLYVLSDGRDYCDTLFNCFDYTLNREEVKNDTAFFCNTFSFLKGIYVHSILGSNVGLKSSRLGYNKLVICSSFIGLGERL